LIRASHPSLIMALFLVGALSGGALELTGETFDKAVFEAGKSGFIKFLAPW